MIRKPTRGVEIYFGQYHADEVILYKEETSYIAPDEYTVKESAAKGAPFGGGSDGNE